MVGIVWQSSPCITKICHLNFNFLSQPCGSSVCKRYQLRPKYLYDHAFMVNRMIMKRPKVLETQMFEAINLDKIDEFSDNVNYQHIDHE